jgi:hypothetical protein
MKPIILITLYRRYHEFCNSIENIERYKKFFKVKPDIYVIWSSPENGKLWLFEDLIKKDIIQKLITRKGFPNENGKHPTSFFESHNIRLGLETVFRDHPDSYCIVQAADVKITEYGFNVIENEMISGASAVTFIWNNRFTTDAWATNCFAVSSARKFWPPFVEYDTIDTLERYWYKEFAKNSKKDYITVLGNQSNFIFTHEHKSEKLPKFLDKFIVENESVGLFIKGQKSLIKRIYDFWVYLIGRYYAKDKSNI